MKDSEQGNEEVVNELEDLRQKVEKLEATLRRTSQDFRIVADFTYDWEYWITASGWLQYVSPSCERITGYRPQEFTEDLSLLERIVHPDDRSFVEMHMCEDVNNPEKPPQAVDFRIVDRSGTVRWIGHECQSVFGDRGEWLGRRCSNRDITERKKAEEQKESLLVSLQEAFAKIKILSGFLPICASCKKIRDDEGYWHQIESYISDHSDAEFSHGICPTCARRLYPELYRDET
jgi:PAS domain S-box-containing protein